MLLLHNAKIHDVEGGSGQASALLIDEANAPNGRIVAMGQKDALQAEAPQARTIDLGGRNLLPGLTDAHMHFRRYALSLKLVDVDRASKAEALERVRAKASELAKGEWLLGHGWRQNNWPEGFGSAADLDAVAPDNPVYLTAASLHAAWANSAALKLAGIDGRTRDPEKGEIARDEAGKPTGILLESAMQLVGDVIPQAGREESLAAMKAAQETLWRMGITSIHDFDRLRSFEVLQAMREEGSLRLRVHKNLPVEALDEIIELRLRSGFGDDLLWIGGIKDFADGALGPKTAAMIEPYEDSDTNRGILLADAEEITEWGQRAVSAGLSMTVHAIGDRANHEVLNAYERVRGYEKEQGLKARRHRIEHVQIIHPDDLGRLAQLGIHASVQPIHQPSDREAADRLWGKRSANAYAWKSLQDAGAPLAFGSDAPVESPNPFWGLHAALTRQGRDEDEAGSWYPEQRMGLAEALRGYSSGPAYFAGRERDLGRLAAGYLADLIVLEEDPFEVSEKELAEIKPLATMLGGEWVWKSEEAAF